MLHNCKRLRPRSSKYINAYIKLFGKVIGNDQEIPQSQTADKPMAS